MNTDMLTGLAIFALVSSITPGPNTLMLLTSGANFGVRRSLPHMLGVGFGFALMVILVGAGLMHAFDRYPVIYPILKVLSLAYLLVLAYRIARASPLATGTGQAGKPLTLIQAALFQWMNPKAWSMALTAISVYSPAQNLQATVLVALIFGSIALPSVSLWAVLGQRLSTILYNPKLLRAFNLTMATILVASLYPVVFGQ